MPLYGLCADPKDFAIHGFGITLYFIMVKFLIYLSFVLLCACTLVLLIYCNGETGGNQLQQGNSGIRTDNRVAGIDYYSAQANQWSIARSTVPT